MALLINEECINCDACVAECPNNAIYEPSEEWSLEDSDEMNPALSNEFYYIATDKCTECEGFHDEPQCAEVCPVDACVPE